MQETSETPLVKLTVAARRENVALVRHVLAGFSDGGAVPSARMADALVAVSDAVTNVVESGPPSRAITIVGDLHERALVVEIHDGGHGLHASPDPTGLGHGLPLMATLADHLEFRSSGVSGPEVVLTFDF
mgnify:CR=1 FL=1